MPTPSGGATGPRSDRTPADAPYLERLAGVAFQPFFILGLHRSGSSFLYRLLGETGCFNTLTAYHIIRYDELLHNHARGSEVAARRSLTAELRAQGQRDRGIDALAVDADFPEEYGFLLARADLRRRLTPRSLPLFVEMGRKVQLLAAEARPLLLKNPFDLDNVDFIRAALPEARFVFIHRHPTAVLTSGGHAVRSLLARRNPYTALLSRRYAALFDRPAVLRLARLLDGSLRSILVPLWVLAARRRLGRAAAQRRRLPVGSWTELRYEDLCRDPGGCVGAVLAAFGLDPETVRRVRTPAAPRRSTPIPRFARAMVNLGLRRYCDELGYGPQPAPGGGG